MADHFGQPLSRKCHIENEGVNFQRQKTMSATRWRAFTCRIPVSLLKQNGEGTQFNFKGHACVPPPLIDEKLNVVLVKLTQNRPGNRVEETAFENIARCAIFAFRSIKNKFNAYGGPFRTTPIAKMPHRKRRGQFSTSKNDVRDPLACIHVPDSGFASKTRRRRNPIEF